MSLFNNWFQIAKQKPLLYGWLLDSSVVHFDHRNEMQMQSQLFENKTPKQDVQSVQGKLDNEDIEKLRQYLANNFADDDFIAELNGVYEYHSASDFEKLVGELYDPKTEYFKTIHWKNPAMITALHTYRPIVEELVQEWIRDVDAMIGGSDDDDDDDDV